MSPLLEHKHYIIRASVKHTKALQDLKLIEEWMKELIHSIDMKILIDPVAVYCDKENNKGVTAIAAIETSHLALHIWDEVDPAVMQFDLYSCKQFDESIVLKSIDDTFGLVEHASMVLARDPFLSTNQ